MPFSLSRIGRTGRLDAREWKYTRSKTKTHYGDVRGIRIDFGKPVDFDQFATGHINLPPRSKMRFWAILGRMRGILCEGMPGRFFSLIGLREKTGSEGERQEKSSGRRGAWKSDAFNDS